MKNSKLFPFERNKYYYGKLLSVNDFELEQKYMNDKRRTMNRFLYGSGVVAGLYVLAVDDFSISVESGLALDFSGREIVIDNPVIKKLALIDGYEACAQLHQSQGYMYLCLDYMEADAEPVYNVAGKNTANAETDYNKVREGYRLFLTDKEPEADHLSAMELYTDIQTIYWGNGIRIRQKLPRFARSGQKVPLVIEVENMGQQQMFAFSYDLALSCCSHEGRSNLKVSFNEALFERSGRYEISYMLDIHEVADTEGLLDLEEDSFRLSVEQRQITAKAQGRQSIHIAAADMLDSLERTYYQENMEIFLKNNFQQSIYLAKISLIPAGESYVIQKIENVPFHQYVAGNPLLDARTALLKNQMLRGHQAGGSDAAGGTHSGDDGELRFAQGEVVIRLGEKVIRGKRFYSEEITHGLGIGQATVILSMAHETEEVYGSSEVFEDVEPAMEIAAKLNRDKGSFIIGVRPVTETMKESVRVHWTVIKDTRDYMMEKKERKIFIKPNVLNLKTRESYYLEAICSNLADKRLKWSVRDNCGTIDSNGLYTAPNTTGVFEVTAQSVAYPEVRASIFVIVREPSEEEK